MGMAPKSSSKTARSPETGRRAPGFNGGDGGAIEVDSYWDTPNPQYQKLTLDGVTFSNNRADGCGGAIHIDLANVAITRSTFTSNYGYDGGAIYQEPRHVRVPHTDAGDQREHIRREQRECQRRRYLIAPAT